MREVVGFLILLGLLCPANALVPEEWSGDGNNLNLGILRPGDIILCRGCAGWLEETFGNIVGYWHHAAMYIGNGQMIEAWKDGVRIVPVSMVNKASEVAVYRVSTTDAVRYNAINWAKSKVGLPYDYKWLTYVGGKEIEGSSYYCSELIWAAYLKAGGPDIDQNPGWSWRYGYSVAPQELADDSDTYLVARAS
ncbi:MAG: YiiX/YebB-like N1pC/P60 family cysteine hydrolase [Archaeoglobaceae archaeon]